jgi:hypothetical protein
MKLHEFMCIYKAKNDEKFNQLNETAVFNASELSNIQNEC